MNDIFVGEGINEVYYKTIKKLYNRPDYLSEPRGLKIKELMATTMYIRHPRRRIITYHQRNLSLRYLVGELAFYLSGSRSLKFISHYSKFWNNVSDDGKTVNSCYGYKLFIKRTKGISQFEYAREQLYQDTDTRRAVMIIYTSDNTKLKSHDNPCTMYLHFFIRDWQLILHTYIRSNDIWFGVSYDIPFFTILQELMLMHLKQMDYEKFSDLVLGPYFHHSGSLHLYNRNFNQAKELIDDPIGYGDHIKEEMPEMTLDTINVLGDFLETERHYRLKKPIADISFSDPFLKTLMAYLYSEENKK